jgi:hypothetical protein
MAFPKIDACVVCEAVRAEILGKHILLGVFGLAPHAQVSLRNLQQPATLCFVFYGGGGEGKFNVELRVADRQGLAIPNAATGIVDGELEKGKLATSVFLPFHGTFGKPGKYGVTMVGNDVVHYSTTVDIAQMM